MTTLYNDADEKWILTSRRNSTSHLAAPVSTQKKLQTFSGARVLLVC